MKKVAVGIILHKGRVLACQRKADGRYPLKWEFPGGKVEAGESHAQAMIRELHEELSITVTDYQEFFQQDWVYPASVSEQNTSGAFSVTYFLVRTFSGDPVNRAFEQIRWVRPAGLLSMDILEGNLDAVKKLVRYEEENEQAA
jgi:8-oxo-dGTP diphosphatase